MKSILIVGGTSGIAKACCRAWASKENYNFSLIVRDTELGKLAAHDLQLRFPNSKFTISCVNFIDPVSVDFRVSEVFIEGTVDIALIAHGILPDQLACEGDPSLVKDSLEVNMISPIIFSESIVKQMSLQSFGSLAIIGSVAGDRGRKSNYIYGCAKGALDRYCEGLRHRFYKKNIHITLVKPGPTKTPMTSHMHGGSVLLADPDDVALQIINGIEAEKSIIYCPKKWKMIMAILRSIPESIFNRLNI